MTVKGAIKALENELLFFCLKMRMQCKKKQAFKHFPIKFRNPRHTESENESENISGYKCILCRGKQIFQMTAKIAFDRFQNLNAIIRLCRRCNREKVIPMTAFMNKKSYFKPLTGNFHELGFFDR